MSRQFHGVGSIGFIFIAIIVGSSAIFLKSFLFGSVYLCLSLIGFLVLVYAFCSKCPCRSANCGHVFPGKLTLMLPKRKGSAYKIADYTGVVIPLLFMIIFPQFWVWQHPIYGYIFWVLFIIAMIDILLKVCPECKNEFCPVNKKCSS